MKHRRWNLAVLAAVALSCVNVSAQSIWQGTYGVTGPLAQNAQGLVVSYDGNNSIAIQPLIGADRFYASNVFGQGTVTANVEAGLAWKQHDWLTGVTQYTAPTAAGEVDMHATWVTAVIGAYDPTQVGSYPYYKLGIAPLTDLNSGAIATSWFNLPAATGDDSAYFNVTPKSFYNGYNYYTAQQTWQHTVYGAFSQQGSADVINSSWGFGDPTATDALTQAADGMARSHPQTTIVFAAGNSTTLSNTANNVGGPASGYNNISVGAVGDFSPTNYTTIAEFSSRGPQDYYDPVHGLIPGVRAPVSIVAPGTTLLSAYYGGQSGGNGPALRGTVVDATSGATNYFSYGLAGTSFAAPIVSGGVSLLDSASYLSLWGPTSRDSRVIKAVLLNSATKLPGWSNGQQTNNSGVVVTTQSLDYLQGAGMINLDHAYDQYLLGTTDVAGQSGGTVASTGWDYASISKDPNPSNTSHNDYVIQSLLKAGTMFDTTLSWFRDLGAPVFTDNANPDLQDLTTTDDGFANLNLELWDASFTHLYAASISPYNDVQELHFTIPADGNYGIRVTYAAQMFGTPQAENYGLAWAVPEPGTLPLLLAAMVGGWMVRSHRRKKRCRESSFCFQRESSASIPC